MLHWIQQFFSKNRKQDSISLPRIDFEALYAILGYRFTNPALLEQALKHRSILPALHQTRVESNERLELLGDAVLGLVVTEFLFNKYPDKEEGELTAMKSLLVSRKILAKIARTLTLGEFMLLSDSEVKSGGRNRISIIADAMESVIGAVYLDGGLENAKSFIVRNILGDYQAILSAEQHRNFKSILLEYTQSKNLGVPFYSICSEDGPDHNKVFTVEVKIQNKIVGRGVGNSKKRAEQSAAQDALAQLEI
ncbi:MAG TPA: ribonuclease III [Bacteroidetes bacterium]|nr:ribonuclease III [Bacteroidota bacterium]